ncbi:MAG: phenylalanine--tRNA ligase beta subunit-related protein [Candidatus Dojkabacteria bacterium]|nr:phenylalanine--tRNA ligase beta subunit-related protein [Candidatus Dojkabacteria bacterium]
MNVLYSQLKKYLPDLKDDARKAADIYTEIGFMIDKFLEVEYNGEKDNFLDLEVRQNRADLFGIIGLAKELSAYYDIKLDDSIERNWNLESHKNESLKNLPIEVKAKDAVKRVLAIKIEGITVKESPAWLKEYLELYEINSINNLVDITNYVMLQTAFPSHAFDIDKMGSEGLTWEIDPAKYKKIKTLNGEEVELNNESLLISEGGEAMSLGIIGGTKPAIDMNSKNIIIEIGVYDPGLIRRNGRRLNIRTEAGARLEKYLDPEGIDYAFEMLTNLILKHCGGSVTSNLYEWRGEGVNSERDIIQVDLDKVQQIAGIKITYDESKTYLTRLGFEIVNEENNLIKVKRPLNRLDVEQEEDVFEEIIRLKGFYKIPTDDLTLRVVKETTPSHIKLMDSIYSHLTSNGFDEVRSWVLVDEEKNSNSNYREGSSIKVQNSINEGVPILRQTIISNLFGQLEEYSKNNINPAYIFEIGKAFREINSEFKENYSLAIAISSDNVDELRLEVETLLRSLGIAKVSYSEKTELIPNTAHPKSIWEINVLADSKKVAIGIIYLSNEKLVSKSSVAEIDLDLIDNILSNSDAINSSIEINQKLVSLDTNIVLNENNNINSYVEEILKTEDNIWSWEVADIYKEEGKGYKIYSKSYILWVNRSRSKRNT